MGETEEGGIVEVRKEMLLDFVYRYGVLTGA